MNIEQLRGVIARNMALDPNDDFGTEKCWEEMTAILSEDIIATLHYFENECTDEELYWFDLASLIASSYIFSACIPFTWKNDLEEQLNISPLDISFIYPVPKSTLSLNITVFKLLILEVK